MNTVTEAAVRIVSIGIGATAVMDAWLMVLKRLHVPTLDFALVGRWAGHVARGQWAHEAIAKAAPIRGERVLGWLIHYATGVAFAGVLVAVYGTGWMHAPSVLPAITIGLGTVLAPLLVVQPAMGAGIASSRTRTPLRNCVRSVLNHAVFGMGLYVAAAVLAACPG